MGGINGGGGRGAAKCEELLRIELPYLRKHKFLTPGASGTLRFSSHEGPAGVVRVYSKDDGLYLYYRARRRGESWRDVVERVEFGYTETQFDGRRLWLCCPGCWRHCGVLYCGRNGFRCRVCCQLTYASQYQRGWERARSRAEKLHARLGGVGELGEPLPVRPRYMHRDTHAHLYGQYRRAIDAYGDGLDVWSGAILDRFGHLVRR
jgi:hypothetical protein